MATTVPLTKTELIVLYWCEEYHHGRNIPKWRDYYLHYLESIIFPPHVLEEWEVEASKWLQATEAYSDAKLILWKRQVQQKTLAII